MWKLLAKQIVQYRVLTTMWMLLKRQSPPSARGDSVDLLPLPSASVSASLKKKILLSPVASVPFFCSLSCVLSPFHVCLTPSCGPPSPFSCTLGVWRKDNMRKKFVIEQLKRRTTQPQLEPTKETDTGRRKQKNKNNRRISLSLTA